MDYLDTSFYKGKRVLITGHTGFKGSWLCRILLLAGAEITGYALPPATNPNLFTLAGLQESIDSVIGDVRNFEALKHTIERTQPEIVFHLAAQPIVREGYKDPVNTYETNVMGTVHILECIRCCTSVHSFVNVTTDKVYQYREGVLGYRENEPLDGFDPYSNSKSCSELVTHCYVNSFFSKTDIAVSTARAGNVIGGGDFASDRIIPDCIRAVYSGDKIIVRNPNSSRPYQHVLEPLFAYLMIAQYQYKDRRYAGWYNVGPNESDCITTGELVDLFCKEWGDDISWLNQAESDAPHEADFLKLDCSKIKTVFGWKPQWSIHTAVEKTVEWVKGWLGFLDVPALMDKQICVYQEGSSG